MTREHWLSFDESPAGFTGLRWVLIGFAVLFAAWHVATNLLINEPPIWQNAIHFGGFAFLASIIFPVKFFGRSFLALDVMYGLVVALSACWVVAAEPRIYEETLSITGQSWQFNVVDWFAGVILIFAAFDFSRRVSGWVIPVLIVVAISYILFLGEYLPGVFRAASLPLDDILFRTIYNDEGLFGILANISSSNIALFMIFGAFWWCLVPVISSSKCRKLSPEESGWGGLRRGIIIRAYRYYQRFGRCQYGVNRRHHDPLNEVFRLQGSVCGGNRSGCVDWWSTDAPNHGCWRLRDGKLYVDSLRNDRGCFSDSCIPLFLIGRVRGPNRGSQASGWRRDRYVDQSRKIVSGALTFVIPLGVMIYLLMTGVTPSFAASGAIGVLIVASWISWVIGRVVDSSDMQSNVMNFRRVCQACLFGIRGGILTAILMVAIGVINNAIVTSGIGNGFSLMIAQWSQGSLVIAILLIGLASLVLGMGLPVTAAYIIMAILCAPALAGILADTLIVEQLMVGLTDPAQAAMFMLVDSPHAAKVMTGMSLDEATALMSAVPFEVAMTMRPMLVDAEALMGFLLVAHLIIFWLSQDSNVTPPVCLAAFTAAGIAKSPPMATGFQSWKAAKGLYVVPLLFAYTPLVNGTFIEMCHIGFFALFGIYAINAIIARFSEGP